MYWARSIRTCRRSPHRLRTSPRWSRRCRRTPCTSACRRAPSRPIPPRRPAPVGGAPNQPSAFQSLTGRMIPMPASVRAASLASSRRWFHFRNRSYSIPGLCGLVSPSMRVGVVVAVHGQADRRQPLLLECHVGLDHRLRTGPIGPGSGRSRSRSAGSPRPGHPGSWIGITTTNV